MLSGYQLILDALKAGFLSRVPAWLSRLNWSYCILGLLIAGGCAGSGEDELGLRCRENIHDFGKVNVGSAPERMRHVFVLENRSKADILVKEVRSSCGCIVIDPVKDKVVRPDEKFPLDVEFSVAGRPGRITKTLDVLSDKAPNLELAVSAVIVSTEAICAYPEKLNFGQVDAAAVASRELKLTRCDGGPLSIGKLNAMHDWLSVDSSTETENRTGEFMVKLSVNTGQLSPGLHHSAVQISKAGSDDIVSIIPVEVTVVAPPSAYAKSIWVDSLRPGQSRSVSYVSDKQTSSELELPERIEMDPPDGDLTVSLDSDNPGSLKLQRRKDSSGARLVSGKLVLKPASLTESVTIELMVWFDGS